MDMTMITKCPSCGEIVPNTCQPLLGEVQKTRSYAGFWEHMKAVEDKGRQCHTHSECRITADNLLRQMFAADGEVI